MLNNFSSAAIASNVGSLGLSGSLASTLFGILSFPLASTAGLRNLGRFSCGVSPWTSIIKVSAMVHKENSISWNQIKGRERDVFLSVY
uniref:Agenet domain-containing family protein n=1 Tax=Rhizophora mucronata TaxID=61149 RepID=A0A2P2M6W8_RHIMU